ncbi:putative membrane protein [Clostridium bornimense]|uniref:Putative membrane protein n=1 Tax=Clostridium bornimense TaxID=1216932 RepID=W6S1D3_9CLOT|nr:DUF4179 domain-containing protein [Clostridium bornimense]CDM68102.1 putative membrane protein [Clostridium bornimense]
MSKFDEIKIPMNIEDVIRKEIKRGKRYQRRRKIEVVIIAITIIVAVLAIIKSENIFYKNYLESKHKDEKGNINSLYDKEINEYKNEINKSSEDNDVVMTLKEAILDNNNLIVQINVDYSKYLSKHNEEVNIDREEIDIKNISLYSYESTIDGNTVSLISDILKFNSVDNCDIVLNFLVEDFNDSDTHDVNLSISKVFIQRIDINSSMSIDGNWNFNFGVDNKLLNKVNVKMINKEIYVPNDNPIDIQHMDISEVRVSPISINVKYIKYSGRGSNNIVYFTVEDEKGNKLENLYVDESHSQWCYAEYIIPEDAKKLVIKPYIEYLYGESEARETEIQWFENDFIEIELK